MATGRLRIKMCGMTRAEDVAFAADLGVDAIGLIFYPQSARCVSLSAAKAWFQPFLFMDVTAVFVNPEPKEVQAVLDELSVQYLQFHGEESPEFCMQFKKPYIKSVSAVSLFAIETMIKSHPDAAGILLDTPSLQKGGSGQCFDWKMIPRSSETPLILAGGLCSENISAIPNNPALCAVDVSSGIEKSVGIKDHAKMKLFVNAVREKNHESK